MRARRRQLLEEAVIQKHGADSPVTKAVGNSDVISYNFNYGFRVILYLE